VLLIDASIYDQGATQGWEEYGNNAGFGDAGGYVRRKGIFFHIFAYKR
jgi:hypothetical protein